MRYVTVKNWRKHQSYEGKRPQWIKLFRDLLNPVEQAAYTALPDGAKLTLIHLWLMASETDNKTPETWLTRERLNMQTRPRVNELVDAGFLTYVDANVNPPHVHLISQSDSESDSPSYENSNFSEIWADVLAVGIPKPVRKAIAFKHFKASVKTPADLADLRKALRNYRVSDRVTRRGFVQDASTWFNNWRDWVDYVEKAPVNTDPNLTIGAEPIANDAREVLHGLIVAWKDQKGPRPPADLNPIKRETWDRMFELQFKFKPDEWPIATDEQCEAWLTALAVAV
jgi:hypothetical protein